MMASSRIGCLQTLQLYEQLAHIGDPSDRRSKFVSAVTWFAHFAQLKQSTWKKDCLGNGIMVNINSGCTNERGCKRQEGK